MLHTQSEDALRELDEKIWNAQTQAQKRRILVDSDQERSVRSKLNEDITGNAGKKDDNQKTPLLAAGNVCYR